MTLIPKIDDYSCAGHGDCAVVAPDVFDIEDVAVVIGTGPDDLILEAARACPSTAIAVYNEAGAQVYP
ncbi:MAG TPA: ferredoxin [Thermoleophilaceae bacterium]|jgi:ferredoxin|nr:ferredoxin [Thermoleophilaceae bacterium]